MLNCCTVTATVEELTAAKDAQRESDMSQLADQYEAESRQVGLSCVSAVKKQYSPSPLSVLSLCRRNYPFKNNSSSNETRFGYSFVRVCPILQ